MKIQMESMISKFQLNLNIGMYTRMNLLKARIYNTIISLFPIRRHPALDIRGSCASKTLLPRLVWESTQRLVQRILIINTEYNMYVTVYMNEAFLHRCLKLDFVQTWLKSYVYIVLLWEFCLIFLPSKNHYHEQFSKEEQLSYYWT